MKCYAADDLQVAANRTGALRDADAAKRLFRNRLSDRSHPQPRVINTDLATICGLAIAGNKEGRDAP